MKSLTVAIALAAVSDVAAAPVPKGAGDGNPLPVNTVWTGRLTQRGGGPTDFDCRFTVTRRDGEKFEAELRAKSGDLEVTYLVRGTIMPLDTPARATTFDLRFQSYAARDVKNAVEILNVPYRASLTGKTITGTWKLPADSPFGALGGDFKFGLAPKKD